MQDTHLYKIKMQERRLHAREVIKLVDQGGENAIQAKKEAARLALENQEVVLEESDRVRLTNQFLRTVKHLLPIFLMLESLSTGQGFVMAMTVSERILLGYGFTVIRLGYMFAPLVFLSWTVQLLAILLFPASIWKIHLLYSIGLSSIRLTHYTASVEDLTGRGKKGRRASTSNIGDHAQNQ